MHFFFVFIVIVGSLRTSLGFFIAIIECISIGSCTSAADVQVDDHGIVRKREDARESQARATDIQVHSKHILSILRTYL